MDYYIYKEDEDLLHYGVLGMKWGIRRYQNEDGTLTPLGRRRVKKTMKQRDIVMTTPDEKQNIVEYKRFRSMIRKMYPAEVAQLMLEIDTDKRISDLTNPNTIDNTKRSLDYLDKVSSIAKTNVESAAKTEKLIRDTITDVGKLKSKVNSVKDKAEAIKNDNGSGNESDNDNGEKDNNTVSAKDLPKNKDITKDYTNIVNKAKNYTPSVGSIEAGALLRKLFGSGTKISSLKNTPDVQNLSVPALPAVVESPIPPTQSLTKYLKRV